MNKLLLFVGRKTEELCGMLGKYWCELLAVVLCLMATTVLLDCIKYITIFPKPVDISVSVNAPKEIACGVIHDGNIEFVIWAENCDSVHISDSPSGHTTATKRRNVKVGVANIQDTKK